MSEPNLLDMILGALMPFAMIGFVVAAGVCRRRIDAWALDQERKEGRGRDYFHLLPPVTVVTPDWRFLARFRDRAGYAFAGCVLYFIGRAFWHNLS